MSLMEDKNSLAKSNLKIDCSAGKKEQIDFKNDCFGLIKMIVPGRRFHFCVSLQYLGSDFIFRVPSLVF